MTRSPEALPTEELLAQMSWVRALARRLLRDADLAEDAVQDTCVRALERPPRETLGGPGLRAWLARVTRAAAQRIRRGDEARRMRERRSAAREEPAPSAYEVVERTSLQQELVAHVMELDEPYRAAVLMRFVDGLGAREIARRQGTTAANARQRVSRGLAMLRSRLDRAHGRDGSSWALALIPLARAGSLGLLPVLGGSVIMSTPFKLASAAALVLVGFVGYRMASPNQGVAVSESEATPAEVTGPRLLEPALSQRVDAPSSAGSRTRVTFSPTEPAKWVFRARLIGPWGDPVPGATLVAAGREAVPSRPIGSDGTLELTLTGELPIVEERGTERLVRFLARAPSHGEVARLEPVAAPGVIELGEMRLVPVSAISGVVLEPSGQPVPGAEVKIALPVMRDPAELRLTGRTTPPCSASRARTSTGASWPRTSATGCIASGPGPRAGSGPTLTPSGWTPTGPRPRSC